MLRVLQARSLHNNPIQLANILVGALARSLSSNTSSFGYQDIPTGEKARRVRGVFDSVAPSYDVMNDLMSVGMHRLWKNWLVEQLKPFPGMRHVDVAGGTGDVASRVAQSIAAQQSQAMEDDPSSQASVLVCDINPAMLAEGQRRLDLSIPGHSMLQWIAADAEKLPLPDQSVDGYTVAFGVRNMTNIPAALREARRVLRPGGQFLCLEFSPVALPGVQALYDYYSFNIIPKIGKYIANDEQSYQYLVESIRRFPDPDTFRSMIYSAGFEQVGVRALTGGITYIHSGFRH